MRQIILDRRNTRQILGSHEGIRAVWLESYGYPLLMQPTDGFQYPKETPIPYADHLLACIPPVKDGAASR